MQRIKPPLAKDRLPPLDEAINAGQNAPNVFRRRFISIANELRSLGIDTNCAPILDIACNIKYGSAICIYTQRSQFVCYRYKTASKNIRGILSGINSLIQWWQPIFC